MLLRSCSRFAAFALVALLASARLWAADDPAGIEFFESKVRPIFVKHCVECHGEKEQEAGLRLDLKEGWAKGGESGPALRPGKPDESLLIKMVRQLPVKMPPEKKLADDEVAALVKWVELGAPDPRGGELAAKAGAIDWAKAEKHWAYQPVVAVEPPKSSDPKLLQPIDRFLAAKWKEGGVKPAGMADKHTLLRRAFYTLTGLPPTLADVQAFEADKSEQAFAKVVDRLLASPRYGEHQARQWLDLARYAEDRFSRDDQPGANAYPYRDWVIRALNEDMPYDRFLRLQLAADLLVAKGEEPRHRAALGFVALGPTAGIVNDTDRSNAEEWSDRIDVVTRGFLGLTVACARCHDHKYDPIPTEDFYSLAGVFASSRVTILPISPQAEIDKFDAANKNLTAAKEELAAHVRAEADRRGIGHARALPDLVAKIWAWKAKALDRPELKPEDFAKASGLNPVQFVGVHNYLMATNRGDKHYLHPWFAMLPKKGGPREPTPEVRALAELFRDKVIDNLSQPPEKRNLDQINDLFGEKGPFPLKEASLLMIADEAWKAKHAKLAEAIKQRTSELPPEPAKSIALEDNNPRDIQLHLRGNPYKRGAVTPRRFLKILSPSEREAWKEGSGRLQLADAITSPTNPLTARVMANRVWQQHFGQGIVATSSNFGELGARPTHPELLDYLASQLVRGGWSLKKLHREIVLSAAYQRASTPEPASLKADPDNRLLWRFAPRRLAVEQFRDSVLAVAGTLNLETAGGPSDKLDEPGAVRRTIYGKVSRKEPSKFLALWDFADPNITIDRRNETTLPQQMLFLMNSPFVIDSAKKVAARLEGETSPEEQIRKAFGIVLARAPTKEEVAVIVPFLATEDEAAAGGKPSGLSRLERFTQSLLVSNEFFFVN